jgi:ABC-2 type transport system ATP-binding protein
MIEISGLTKYYGEVLAVDRISISIAKGEILGLLGPNGAGKSTTIRMLCGYLPPTQGTITVDGVSVEDDPLSVKKRIGYLPEAAPLYRDMMVYEYLSFVGKMRDLPEERLEERIREVARTCGLAGVMHKNIDELSKGYKQRVGIAHAMISDPDILVLDEPTAGLDPNQIVEIRELIKLLGRTKTVILSSHILSEVEVTCSRIIIIDKGHVVADGSPESIKTQFSGERILSIEVKGVDVDGLKGALSGLPGVVRAEARPAAAGGTALALTSRGDQDVSGPVFDAIKSRNWQLVSFQQETKTLEDIFRTLTQAPKA